MAECFCSHSSLNKDIVVRLVIDLVNRGFPVWLDVWTMGVGDQLYHSIYEGIDESTFLIVVLSEQSVKSDWLNDELNAGLAKEKDIGRSLIHA